ncbi:MAG TPA: hypothetical protein PKE45_17410 [Caldilineaceae bacterium]|nr:hypothetical protein [Caldilineaceae bacterium]
MNLITQRAQYIISNPRAPIMVGAAGALALALIVLAACAGSPLPTPVTSAVVAETQAQQPEGPPADVVVYAADLPEDALSEFEFWDDPASPGGKLVGTPNEGSDLDAPPEDDPHVTFQVPVQGGVPYRCWIHMKVGAPKGISQANKVWVQFSNAVDEANQEVFKPGSESYLTAQGPTQEGWSWVACNLENAEPASSLVKFGTGSEVTVQIQAGMEGVGFDQLLLSPAEFLEQPPAVAVIEK